MNIETKNIQPTEGRILVSIYEGETQTDSGIEISSSGANTAPVIGVILRCGPNVPFTEGDEVLFRRYAMDELTISTGVEDKKIYFLEVADILGVIVKNKVEGRIGNYKQIEIKHANKESENVIEEGSSESSSKEDDSKEKVIKNEAKPYEK